jgi:hypothetical protein
VRETPESLFFERGERGENIEEHGERGKRKLKPLSTHEN